MKKVLSFLLSLMLVLSFAPGALISYATEYETVAVLTGGKDFSTVFSGSGTQLSGDGYTLQNVSSSFSTMAVEEKTAVPQAVAEGVTSAKVITLTPTGTTNPTIRFKGFSAATVNQPMRIKYKIYLACEGESGTYHIQALPQQGTGSSSASGGLETSDVLANQWIEVNEVVTPIKGTTVQGIKFTISKKTATNYPTTVYLDGNIVVEQLKEVIVETPDELLAEAKTALDLGDTSAVTANLTLPAAGANGVTITWATSDATVVEVNGAVHRAAEDKTATLTATLSLEGATSVTKEFTVTVKAEEQGEAPETPVYETVSVLTGDKDFSTVFSGSGTQLSGGGYTLQNVSSSFTTMAVEEKTAVPQTVAEGVTSAKVITLTPTGTTNPTIRFKGFSAATVNQPMRIKYKIYLACEGESGTYHIQALPQQGTGSSSASGGLETSDVPANQWIEVNEVVTPIKGTTVQGIKFTISKITATNYPTTVYLDGNIVVEQLKEVIVKTPDELLADAKTALDLGDTSAVKANLTLPAAGANGVTITWATTDATVVEVNGTIHRGAEDKTVTLTATLSLEGATSVTKEFTVTVKAEEKEPEPPKYETVSVLTDGTDFSTVLAGFSGGVPDSSVPFHMQNVSSSYAGFATNETSEVSSDIAAGVTSAKVIALTPAGNTNPIFRFKWLKAATVGEPMRIKYKIYLACEGETGTYNIQALPQQGTTSTSASGELATANVPANQWIEVEGVVTPVKGKTVQGIKFTISKKTATNYPTTVYLDGNIVVEQVKKIKTPDELIAEAKTALDLGDTSAVKANLTLPAANANGVTITWETSDAAVVEANGTIHRGAEDKTATLTATLSLEGAASVTKEFTVTVAREETAADKVALDKAALDLGNTSAVIMDLVLPTVGSEYQSTITWSTDKPEVVTADGKITRAEDGQTAILTATITNGNASDTKEFIVTVKGTVEKRTLKGIDGTFFYDNTFRQKGILYFGDLFDDSTVNADGWAANGTNGTDYVAPVLDSTSAGERIPGLYAKKTDANGIWYQSLVNMAENNGQGLPIYQMTYTLPEITDNGLPYYIELDAEMYIRDSLTLSFGNNDNGVVEIEKLDQNEHATHPKGKNIFVIRTNNIERQTFPYSYSSNTALSAVKIGIQVIPELKQVLVYKNGELMYSEPLDFSKKSSPIKTLTIKWEHSTVRTTLMGANYLHLKSITLYEGNPLPDADRLTLDKQSLLLTSITNESANWITKDFNLINKGVFGSDITWESSDPDVINSETGAVTRQEATKDVTLTATLAVGDATETKVFKVKVLRKGTEGNLLVGSDVTVEKATTIEDPSIIVDGIIETYVETLNSGAKPKFIIDLGSEMLLSQVIIYERMLKEQYNIKRANLEISKDGTTWNRVAVLENGIGGKKVVNFAPQAARYITLTVTNVDADKTVSLYEIEAIMSADDNSIVDADISVLKPFDSFNVTQSVVLPITGQLGSTITWSSSNTGVVDNIGNVTRPAGAGANVTLTATVTYGDVTKTVSFSHYVTGLASGGSGSGGSGSGGSGSGGGNDKVTGGGAMNEAPAKPETPDTPAQPESGIFNDVEETNWAYPYIEKLYTEKIMEGDGKGNFDPKRPIKREEFLKILLLALDVEIEENGDSVFSDVNSSDWYAPFVNTAYKLGLTNGMGDGSFGVGQTISRQDMAVLANRVAALKGVELTAKGEKKITDIDSVSDYAKESVQILANAGIISGDEYAIFNPEGNALREQAAKIICMMMELKAE